MRNTGITPFPFIHWGVCQCNKCLGNLGEEIGQLPKCGFRSGLLLSCVSQAWGGISTPAGFGEMVRIPLPFSHAYVAS
jgi:hypothetical protein